MELGEDVKELLIQTAKALKESEKRLFLARTVRASPTNWPAMLQPKRDSS